MKKRFISMALCMLMLVTAVVTSACDKDDEPEGTLTIEGGTSARPMTVSLWGIKGEGTTDEAIAEVEAAMSKITEAKFNTAIDLILLEEDEYEKKLTEYMDDIQAGIDKKKEEEAARKQAEKEAKARGETLAPETTEPVESDTAEETILDEYGLPATLYPEVADDQLDIFLITDYDMLEALNEKKVLSSLDDELNGESKLIRSYVHSTFLSAGKMNGKTVAIINQQTVGDYTYMLVNKELLAKYYWDIDNITSLDTAYQFILDVKRSEPDYQPFVGDISPINIEYYSPDGQTTVFGSMLAPDAVYGDDFAPDKLLNNKLWLKHMKAQHLLSYYDCIGSETFTAEDKFGVGIMKGKAEDVAAFEEDYHVVTLQAPQGTADNLYNGMFAVSIYTKNLQRSMEIITYLNTNAEFRDVFGHGVEGVHYKLNENGGITKLTDDYNVKLEYTGNCFITYPLNGEPKTYWDTYEQHNVELVLSPFFQFDISGAELDMDQYEKTIAHRDEFYAALAECATVAEIDLVVDDYLFKSRKGGLADNWIEQNPEAPSDEEEPPMTAGKFYKDWLASKQ